MSILVLGDTVPARPDLDGFGRPPSGHASGMAADPTQHRDLVVLGASAGGVEALCEVMGGLPAGLPAAVLVVTHMPAVAHSALANVLDRCGALPVGRAEQDAPLLPGRVYVAVPDRHLLVRDGHMLISRAPHQNRARPAVDALFRSAARWHGRRAVGVVLSGALDDGAAGLAAIDAAGGACAVQDPGDARHPGMPEAAISVVPGALVAPARLLGEHITALVREPISLEAPSLDADLITESDMAENSAPRTQSGQPGRPAAISCPDCSGGMNIVRVGAAVTYTCHIGHIWSPQTLIAAQQAKIEQALWTGVSMLEEQASIHEELARRAVGAAGWLTENHQRAAADEIRKATAVIRKHFPEFLPPA
jgi:two-component system chemotaxis response regulator CheB